MDCLIIMPAVDLLAKSKIFKEVVFDNNIEIKTLLV